jgi:uncharacterized peroxidase-related enzyme
MAHIQLPQELPGIRALMAYRPETATALNGLAEVLLRGDNSLSRGERELIATYVSSLNDCRYCQSVHGAVASHYLEDQEGSLVDQVKQDYTQAPIPAKMKALLALAAGVQKGGKHVTTTQVERAKADGATDAEIHDTVLIAAAFCMFNRYVDGLATWAPDNPQVYRERAGRLAEVGYAQSNPYR